MMSVALTYAHILSYSPLWRVLPQTIFVLPWLNLNCGWCSPPSSQPPKTNSRASGSVGVSQLGQCCTIQYVVRGRHKPSGMEVQPFPISRYPVQVHWAEGITRLFVHCSSTILSGPLQWAPVIFCILIECNGVILAAIFISCEHKSVWLQLIALVQNAVECRTTPCAINFSSGLAVGLC